MKTLKLKDLKTGNYWYKYGFCVYFSAGFIHVSCSDWQNKYATLKEAKKAITEYIF